MTVLSPFSSLDVHGPHPGIPRNWRIPHSATDHPTTQESPGYQTTTNKKVTHVNPFDCLTTKRKGFSDEHFD